MLCNMLKKFPISKSGNSLISRLSVVSLIWFPNCGMNIVKSRGIIIVIYLLLIFLFLCSVLYLILRKIVSNNSITSVKDKNVCLSFTVALLIDLIFVFLFGYIVPATIIHLFFMILFCFVVSIISTKWILRNSQKSKIT
jgi:hypothetical protein